MEIITTDTALEMDYSKKLEIKFSNKKPIQLSDLSQSLLAIGSQYEKFIENEADEEFFGSSELYIKDVRSGSIIIELITQNLPILPLLWQGGSLLEWTNQISNTINWLLGESDKPPKEIQKQDLKQWGNILEPVAKDNGSQLNFNVYDGGSVVFNVNVNSLQANAAGNRIKRELEKLDEPDDHIQKRKVMYWYQTKFDDESHTGDKAIIESITDKPVKVIFENNAVKKAMLKGEPRFKKPWNELAYLVDIKVQTVRNLPKVYTIINYYDEDTFDPNE